MTARRGLTVLVLVISLILPGAAARVDADAVNDWNELAQQFIAAGHPGPAGILDSAMVQAAVHDAVQAYDGRFEPYAAALGPGTGSPVAAVAAAARGVLAARLPTQAAAVDLEYLTYLSDRGLGTDAGIAVGEQAAAAVLAARAGDGSFPVGFPNFTGGTAPGQWRPTPPAFQPMAAPWMGAVRPFTRDDTGGCQPAPVPALASPEYARHYNEVKTLGSATSARRTPAQTSLARFYSENFISQWNRALRWVATTYLPDIADRARLLALANLAGADALICTWETKRSVAFWRPMTAIHEGDADGNPATDGDAAWTPFLTNPPYPEYSSGANSLTSAMTRSLALFFGSDHVPFEISSVSSLLLPTDSPAIVYNRFSDAAQDVVDVRVYQGLHFRFADTEARSQGRRVANQAFRNVLRRVD